MKSLTSILALALVAALSTIVFGSVLPNDANDVNSATVSSLSPTTTITQVPPLSPLPPSLCCVPVSNPAQADDPNDHFCRRCSDMLIGCAEVCRRISSSLS
jgi:hypothetical protein